MLSAGSSSGSRRPASPTAPPGLSAAPGSPPAPTPGPPMLRRHAAMRGNPGNLRRAAQAKRAAATARAEQGLRQMLRQGDPVTFRGLAQAAGVSLDFLYRHPDLRRRVEQLRDQQRTAPAPSLDKPDPDHPSRVIRPLTSQLTDLKRRHRHETAQLRHALEAAQRG